MKREFARRPGRRYCLSLMMISMFVTPVWSQSSEPVKPDYVLEYKESYSRTEVEELVEQILLIAEEEMEITAMDAAREAAAEEAGEAEYWKAIAEMFQTESAELRRENQRMERQGKGYKIAFWVTGTLAVVFGSVLAIDHSLSN